MDQSAFYGVVSAINFTLLGLWWVAVKDWVDLVGGTASARRAGYLVSLQFVIPGTVALLAQVAPEVVTVWRTAFAIAGVIGAGGVVMLSAEMRKISDARIAPALFVVFGVPLYIAVAVVAAVPAVAASLPANFTPIQVEALLLTLLVFLGTQEAWVVRVPATPKLPVG
jgi:hypothetical protein